ncbi:hypothetical protein GCM10027614_27480 [Micromonospora vulcania]
MRALFGFVIEGRPDPTDIDAEAVYLHGFQVTDASGEEQAAPAAQLAAALRTMGPPRRLRMGSDGTLREADLGE